MGTGQKPQVEWEQGDSRVSISKDQQLIPIMSDSQHWLLLLTCLSGSLHKDGLNHMSRTCGKGAALAWTVVEKHWHESIKEGLE